MPIIWGAVGLIVGTLVELLVRYLSVSREDTAESVCDRCDLPRLDFRLVPLAGALFEGTCPKCQRSRWQRRLGIQLGCCFVFAALGWRLPFGLPLLVSSFYAVSLLIAFVTDCLHRLIMDEVTYPSIVIALGSAMLLGGGDALGGLWRAAEGGLIAGGMFFALYLLAALLYRGGDGFGMGDVKLALLIGVMTGWPNAMAAILLGSLLGAVIGLALMVRARSGKATMPYGTALSVGAMLSIFLLPPV